MMPIKILESKKKISKLAGHYDGMVNRIILQYAEYLFLLQVFFN